MNGGIEVDGGMDVVTETVMMKPKVEFEDIVQTILYVSRAVELNQPRLLQRGIRQNASVRKLVTSSQLSQLVKKYIPVNWPTVEIMNQMIDKISQCPQAIQEALDEQKAAEAKEAESMEESKESSMDVVSPEDAALGSGSAPATPRDAATAPPVFGPVTSVLPEVETYLLNLIATTLLRYKLDIDAAQTATVLVERIRQFNRRSLDLLSSKAFFYYSLAYERIGRLDQIRPTLLQLYRTSCVRHDHMCQAVLLNLLLSNYLQYNLYEQAHTLSEKAAFPENASNNQFCRYLYSMGRILATQLDYSDSYLRLMMASRKAPQGYALGFSVTVNKLIVIVQLLMGDIPERTLFNQPELREALKPYLELTHAVRNGDVVQFAKVVELHKAVFQKDKNYTLVQRLGHNVLKTGLRKISVSYSRINLRDVADKLQLQVPSGSSSGATAAEYICAKAIRDGVIEAKIEPLPDGDAQESCLCTQELLDMYGTEEPQKAFHKRIAFCLDVHNEAVKSMRYPPSEEMGKKDKDKDGDDKNENHADEKTIEELIREMEDDLDE